MKQDNATLKIDLVNQGYQVFNSKFLPNGRVKLSFSLPKPVMKEWKLLKTYYGSGPDAMEFLIDHFTTSVKVPRQNGTSIYYTEFKRMRDQKYQEFTHKDYQFDSAVIESDKFEKVESIKRLYGISYSAIVRIMVKALSMDSSWRQR